MQPALLFAIVDPKLVLAGSVIGLAIVIGVGAARRLSHRERGDPGVEGNARLTGYAAVILLIPLLAETITGVRPGLEAHALLGFGLIPAVLLKLGSVSYRFVRYYAGDRGYRAAGPPAPLTRVLGPVVVVLTVVLFTTGVELWLFGFELGDAWLAWHKLAFALWFPAMTIHVVAYLSRAPELAISDVRDRLGGTFERRALVVGSLLFGLALALAMLPFASPFALLPDTG